MTRDESKKIIISVAVVIAILLLIAFIGYMNGSWDVVE